MKIIHRSWIFFFYVFFLSFVGYNQNLWGKLGNVFVMHAGDYEQMIYSVTIMSGVIGRNAAGQSNYRIL